MKKILFSLVTLVLTACSNGYDKYVGYWSLDDSKSQNILEIRKEGKETYLVNENILNQYKKEQVLEKGDKDALSVNTGFGVIALNLSEDGNTLRIKNQKYSKMNETDAKKALDNQNACNDLEKKYREETKDLNIFAKEQGDKKIEISKQYVELQKKIPNCSFYISTPSKAF